MYTIIKQLLNYWEEQLCLDDRNKDPFFSKDQY